MPRDDDLILQNNIQIIYVLYKLNIFYSTLVKPLHIKRTVITFLHFHLTVIFSDPILILPFPIFFLKYNLKRRLPLQLCTQQFDLSVAN